MMVQLESTVIMSSIGIIAAIRVYVCWRRWLPMTYGPT